MEVLFFSLLLCPPPPPFLIQQQRESERKASPMTLFFFSPPPLLRYASFNSPSLTQLSGTRDSACSNCLHLHGPPTLSGSLFRCLSCDSDGKPPGEQAELMSSILQMKDQLLPEEEEELEGQQ